MIILPSRRRLIERRNQLYAHLYSIADVATVKQVEDIMRRIHNLNKRLLAYNEPKKYEPKEVLDD